MRESQLIDLKYLRLHGDAAIVDGVTAYDDIVGIECLRDADCRCARGFEVDRKAEMIEGVLAVVAGDGKESGRGEALVEGVGKGVADPREVGLSGAVIEREYKHHSPPGLDDFRG